LSAAVVIGQSHVNAIAEALKGAGASSAVSVYRLQTKSGAPEPGTISTAEAVELVAGLEPSTGVFVSILGTYHNILGLLRSEEDFDFQLSPDDSADAVGATQVPHRAIASAFEAVFSDSNAVKRIQGAVSSPIHLLSTPPPKECNQFILESFLRQKKAMYRGQSVSEIGIETPQKRAKLWLLETQLLRRWAESHGMHFVPAPARAVTDGMFLSRDFYGSDVTHASAAYGALVLAQIQEILQSQEECSANA
jgi:hypothetical protein